MQLPEKRMKALRQLIREKPLVRVLEAHNGLSAKIVENTSIETEKGKQCFDAIWESSLTDSASKGKPDIELIDFTSRVQTINQILEVTTKPIIVDGDTGGLEETFVYVVRTLERLGVSAIIIEDKTFPKRNSLMIDTKHKQEDIDVFCDKIYVGKHSQLSKDFMIIARVESLIANAGLDDAINRAQAYIEAGADAIMIHSKSNSPKEVLTFCNIYNTFSTKVPLVSVPTMYNSIREQELIDNGFSIVIYANQLLRSSYKQMLKTAQNILEHSRPKEAEQFCVPVQDIFDLTKQQRIIRRKNNEKEKCNTVND